MGRDAQHLMFELDLERLTVSFSHAPHKLLELEVSCLLIAEITVLMSQH